jgi:hypothetical protein
MRKIPTLFVRDETDRKHVTPEVTWRPIPGWPYEASNDGQIRRASGGRGARALTVLRPAVTEEGYLRVGLHDDGRRRSTGVHRLVALAFIGDPPTAAHDVNHKNGVKTDNRPDNLEWATCAENIAHAVSMGLRASKVGALNGRAKISHSDAVAIRVALREGATYEQVARTYGIGKSQVWNVKSGRAWGAGA